MPNTREKLIELLEERRMQASEVLGSMNKGFGAWYADHLVANGVTVNGEKYREIDKFIENRILDGKEYPTAKLYYEDYQKELERLYNGVTVQEWISVKDRLPEYGSHILTFSGKDLVGCKTYYGVFEKTMGVRFGKITLDEVTHWMPLPEPPKGE